MTRREWISAAVALVVGWGAPAVRAEDAAEHADDGCILTKANVEIARDNYRRNKEFRSVAWDDKTNTAHVVTKSGESLVIKNWACENLAVEGSLSIRVPRGESSSKYFSEKALWLGMQLLPPEDVEVLKSALRGDEFAGWRRDRPLKLNMEGAFYSSWLTLEIRIEGASALVRLFGTQ